MRTFETGATRNTDTDKLDFDGFLSPQVLESYAEYMHSHRMQEDGQLRDSDNWQKGIPKEQYIKSMWRHFFAVWKGHRAGRVSLEDLNALLFNAMGYEHEYLKEQAQPEERSCCGKWDEYGVCTCKRKPEPQPERYTSLEMAEYRNPDHPSNREWIARQYGYEPGGVSCPDASEPIPIVGDPHHEKTTASQLALRYRVNRT